MDTSNLFTGLLNGIILGAVQGFTEFLPVSSSGHLFIIDTLLHADLPIVFDILLHLATLVAVIVYTFPLIKKLCFALIVFLASPKNFANTNEYTRQREYLRLIVALVISTLCTAPIGLLLKNIVFDANIVLVGTNFLITAMLLLLPFLLPKIRRQISTSLVTQGTQETLPAVSFRHAIILGLVQGIAVLPGISRSGITISIAVLLGLSFSAATKYSFLMAIPAILASFALSVSELPQLIIDISLVPIVASVLVAFLTGLIGLSCLNIVARKGKIWCFSIYLVIIGILSLSL